MRGLDEQLSIGERVAWYRRRRGLSQEVLAGLVGRTVDWLGKVENNRAPLDRLSVLSQLADALDVALTDLLGGPQLMDWTPETRQRTVPALRKAVLSYTALTPSLSPISTREPDPARLRTGVADLWEAYQSSRFGYVVHRLPTVLAAGQAAARHLPEANRPRAETDLAMTYQVAATTLTKLGEVDLAWICSDRGLAAAERSGNRVVIGSLLRSVAHSLLSNSQYAEAREVASGAVDRLSATTLSASPALVSMVGSLHLVGAMAAARASAARAVRAELNEAERQAGVLGRDANHLWSAFGPTNVIIHRVATAMELGDVQRAAELGPRVDATAMPVERRVRHALEVARAYSALNQADEGLSILLAAEGDAPEQVRYHFLSRQLVLGWIRHSRAKPRLELRQLAERLRVA